MKIFLIIPPVTLSAREYVPRNSYPSLGVGYLAAVLEAAGYEVAVLDAFTTREHTPYIRCGKATYGLDDTAIISRIRAFGPDLLGVTSMYTMYAAGAHRMAKIAKQARQDMPVVFGGAYPSCSPELVLSDKNVDIAVRGEGENTFLEIVNALKHKESLENIPGTAVRKNGAVFLNQPRPLIEDLDNLPYPARHLLPMEDYFYNAKHSTLYNMRNPFTTLVSSRGCPMDCVYCAVKTIWGRTWRARSAAKVVDEIEYLVRNYGVKEVHFSDDNITVNKNRIAEICGEIMRRKLNIRWAAPTGIAIWSLDEDLLKMMKTAGCYRLTFGLESGNKETLNFIGKKYSYAKAKQLIKLANRLGFFTASTFIFGFPQETQSSIDDTFSLAKNSGLDFAVFYTPVIFPGTRLFDVYKKAGIEYNPEITGVNNAYASLHFSKDELLRLRAQANSSFVKNRMLRPLSLIMKIRCWEDLLYILRIGVTLLNNLIVNSAGRTNAFGLLHKTKAKKACI